MILLTVSTVISCNFCHMIGSKSVLGRGMSGEEKRNLKQELNSLNMEDISSFMESLPPDFFRILRTE
jgi:aarF domain-containing kinase